jgi:hypothetical protein
MSGWSEIRQAAAASARKAAIIVNMLLVYVRCGTKILLA